MDLSNMNEEIKSIIEVTGWIGKGELPEWLLLWAEHMRKVNIIFEENEQYRKTHKNVLFFSDKRILELEQKNSSRISELYRKYRAEHPEEFKPKEAS